MARSVFEQNLKELHNNLLKMGSIVEKQIHESIEALIKQDEFLANKVIDNDDLVDNLQKEIEDKCIKLIATEQPLAADLRFIFTTSKIVTDLERIADHAVDISKIVKRLKNESYIKELIDIPKMVKTVKVMIKEALDAYVEQDIDKIYSVCRKDDEIDNFYKNIFNELIYIMIKNKNTITQASQFLFIAKYVERIADHVTNICEWTIYLITGEQIDLNE